MFEAINKVKKRQLDCEFAGRLPTPEQAQLWAAINEAGKAFAQVVIENVPWSADRDRAIQGIREAAMLAREAVLTYHPDKADWHSLSHEDDYWLPVR